MLEHIIRKKYGYRYICCIILSERKERNKARQTGKHEGTKERHDVVNKLIAKSKEQMRYGKIEFHEQPDCLCT